MAVEDIPETWRNDLRPELFEMLGLVGLASARPMDGTFVLERCALEMQDGEALIVERPRPGLMRHPFAQGEAAAATLGQDGSVPVSPARRVEPPLSEHPLRFRLPFRGAPVSTVPDLDPNPVLAGVLAAIHAIPVVSIGVHAELGGFVPMESWASAVSRELRLAERALSTHGFDLGAPQRALFERARSRLDPSVEPESPSLTHGGLTEDHVHWHDGEVVEVLGWEHAAAGDPLADVGAVLHLAGGPAIVDALDSPALAEPGAEARVALGYHLYTVRTLATMAATLPGLPPEARIGWRERLRVLVERSLSIDPVDRLHGRPTAALPVADPDRTVLDHVAEVLGSLPQLEGPHTISLAAVVAILELGQGELRSLAVDRIRRIMAGFAHRTPGRAAHPGPIEGLDRIDALPYQGRARALCAARVVHTLEERLGDGLTDAVRAGASAWLALLEHRVDAPAGPAEELVEAAMVAWARPAEREALRPRVERLLRDLPEGRVSPRTASALALAAVRAGPQAPIVVAGMLAMGFGDADATRALQISLPQVNWED